MAGSILLALLGGWLLMQATAGRLPARLLSWRRSGLAGLATPSPGSATSSGSNSSSSGRLSIEEVACVALRAGLAPDAAVIATAIAMRESGGDPTAHNPVPPDDSYGLWQINVRPEANPKYRSWPLTNPATNAKAMFELSRGGTNWQPWQIGGNPLARTDPQAARQAVAAALKTGCR